jgi:hypothetical protein
MRATKLMAQTEARITTSVLINRASAMRGSDARRITVSYQFVCTLTGVKFRQCLKNSDVQHSPWLTALYWMDG